MSTCAYKIVYSKSRDIGLLTKTDENGVALEVIAPASKYSLNTTPYYGGVKYINWINTGRRMTKDEWLKFSCDKSFTEIFNALNVNYETGEMTKAVPYTTSINTNNNSVLYTTNTNTNTNSEPVVNDHPPYYDKKYNVEWYSWNGKINTSSAIMTDMKDGYIFFKYPSGGLLVIKKEALYSLDCLE